MAEPGLDLADWGLSFRVDETGGSQSAMPCPRLPTCQLANGISMREALRVWQSFYCDGMYERCERFKLAEAGREVPPRLLPNGRLQGEPPAQSSSALRRAAGG